MEGGTTHEGGENIIIPPHVPPSLAVNFDMFDIPATDGEYHAAIARYQAPGVPEIFFTPMNGGHWVFTRTADIRYAFDNPQLYSSRQFFVPREKNPDPPMIPMMADAPEHAIYRQLIAPSFRPASLNVLTDRARALAIELIEGFQPRGECEFNSEFAHILPVAIFMAMAGLPESDRAVLQRLADEHVRPLNPQMYIDSMIELQAYVRDKIAERRARPDDDLISRLLAARIDGKPLDEPQLTGMVVLLLLAGLDTVASVLSFFALFLARSPDHRRQLRERPDSIPRAVDEMMRRFGVASPGRVVTRDHQYRGVEFRIGDMLVLPTALAGIDESTFENPFTVNFDRRRVDHASFGFGPHKCIGAVLARAELKIFLEEWLRRIPDFSVKQGEMLQTSTGTIACIRRLPLVWPVAMVATADL